jgi:hypothetical protein
MCEFGLETGFSIITREGLIIRQKAHIKIVVTKIICENVIHTFPVGGGVTE